MQEEAVAAKEREAAAVKGRIDSLADLLSTAGSDAAESVISVSRNLPSNQAHIYKYFISILLGILLQYH